jgi:hypothetical protein
MKEMLLGGLGLVIVGLLAFVVHQNYVRFHKPQITTRYQAVTLVNGDVFFGRIAHLGSDHPVLRDAFSVHEEIAQAGQQPRQMVVRRKDGPTGADHLIFPASAIVSVEPLQAESPIGRLAEQAGFRH